MGDLVSGKQLAAGRVLVGITQKYLAEAASLHVNSVRYVERQPRITTGHSRGLIEDAMRTLGVVFFRNPTPGVRLAGEAELGVVSPLPVYTGENSETIGAEHQMIRAEPDGELSPGHN
jgi:hypothetical protein